jgi:anhydro-N-acetylmuramic acid kinase
VRLPANAPSASTLYLGLISGTSVDAIDAVVVDLASTPRVIAARAFPYESALRSELLALNESRQVDIDALGALDVRVGEAFAAAALSLLAEHGIAARSIRALGSHGQTIRHRPRAAVPFTWQLGDPHVIAERTGLTTVADFRRRDVAAGGQGAPLLPALHAALLADATESRAVLNLGGIANLTALPLGGAVQGFDTGPANGLMDAWCQRHRGRAYDADGAFAASGSVQPDLLASLLAHPYFARPVPKSTGREEFNLTWIDDVIMRHGMIAAADVQATLLELTARSVAQAVEHNCAAARRIAVCGGGVHNPVLMRRLAELLAPRALASSAHFGVDPDFVEAQAFAWLAYRTLAGEAGNLPSVTGAQGPRVLGAIIPGAYQST